MLDDILVKPGTRLIHIGPHKTGTTAIQNALDTRRAELHAQGVHFAWETAPQAYLPAIGLTGLRGRTGGPVAREEDWLDFVAEVHGAGDRRVVASSESFANAATKDIERLADDLGRDRLHIVRMVRRYDKLLPSQWQQRILNDGTKPYDQWLEEVFTRPNHNFWRRHGYARLTRRWSDVVGPENLSVVVVNETDRSWMARVFEELLGLSAETLTGAEVPHNPSRTFADVEVLREINLNIVANQWVEKTYNAFVRHGADVGAGQPPPDPDAGRITLPVDRFEDVLEATRRDVSDLEKIGVRVIGDLRWLDPKAPDGDPVGADRATSSVAVAASRVGGVVNRALTKKSVFSLSLNGAEATVDPPARASRLAVGATPSPSLDSGSRQSISIEPPWQRAAAAWQTTLIERHPISFEDWLRGGQAPQQSNELADLIEQRGARRVRAVVQDRITPQGRRLLGWDEAALLHELVLLAESEGWSDQTWQRYVDEGAVAWMLESDLSSGAAAPLPWTRAAGDALELESSRLLRQLGTRGLQVDGDVNSLIPAGGQGTNPEPRISPQLIARAATGAIAAADANHAYRPRST